MFIYLLYRDLSPTAAGLAYINAKEREKGMTSEKSEEKEWDQGTERETPNPISGNWYAHRGGRAEQKTEENKKKRKLGAGS